MGKISYRFLTSLLLLLAASVLATGARADTLSLDSSGTAADSGQSNSMGSTIAIAPNAAWAPALAGSTWVSYGSTGNTAAPGFFVVPNGTVVAFSDVFQLTGTPTGGTVSVLADDSAAVYLNGTLLVAEAATAGNHYTVCSDTGIGCLLAMAITLPAADLVSGANTLQFMVAQRDGSSFGLDYAGSVSSVINTPEASTLFLLACGLSALLVISIYRRYRIQAIMAEAV